MLIMKCKASQILWARGQMSSGSSPDLASCSEHVASLLPSPRLISSSVWWTDCLDVCLSSPAMSLRLAAGVYEMRVHMRTVIHLPISKGAGNRTGRTRGMELISCCYFLSSNEIRETTLHTCDCLLSVRSKCGNTNELAITGETNPDNAVRKCQRNPPKKQERSLQGPPDSKGSNSNRRENLCPR